MADEMSHLEITVFLFEDDHATRKHWAEMLRDVANKLEAHHVFTREDKWYEEDGHIIAQFHEPDVYLRNTGRIHGLN